ncbi:MAG: amidohydrolase family protein [Candidatus Jordarchaeales archaeon]
MTELILKNGIVFDPINGVEGEKMDVMVKNGVIVEQVNERECKVLDVKGMTVVPGGIDCNAHIASQILNIARMTGVRMPLPRDLGEDYLRAGYTFVVEAGLPFSKVLHAHIVLENVHSLDKACILLLDSNWFMAGFAAEGNYDAAVSAIAWLLRVTRTYGVELVNPLSLEVWAWKREWKGAMEKVKHLDISPLEYTKFVSLALKRLNISSPLYLHPDGAGRKGGCEDAIEILNGLKECGRIHLTHAQFYTLGSDGELHAEKLARYLDSNSDLDADVGCATVGAGTFAAHDAYFTKNVSEKLHVLEQIEVEGIATLTKTKRDLWEKFWEAGLILLLAVNNHSKIQLSMDVPFCGLPLDYSSIAAWLVSKAARKSVNSTERMLQMDELKLQELFTMTRSAPALSLGLGKKGRLTVGADADIAVYDFDPETMDPSRDYERFARALSRAAYTIKGGEIVVKNGEIVNKVKGRTFWVNCKVGKPPEEVLTTMERYLSFNPRQMEEIGRVLSGSYCSVEGGVSHV